MTYDIYIIIKKYFMTIYYNHIIPEHYDKYSKHLS